MEKREDKEEHRWERRRGIVFVSIVVSSRIGYSHLYTIPFQHTLRVSTSQKSLQFVQADLTVYRYSSAFNTIRGPPSTQYRDHRIQFEFLRDRNDSEPMQRASRPELLFFVKAI